MHSIQHTAHSAKHTNHTKHTIYSTHYTKNNAQCTVSKIRYPGPGPDLGPSPRPGSETGSWLIGATLGAMCRAGSPGSEPELCTGFVFIPARSGLPKWPHGKHQHCSAGRAARDWSTFVRRTHGCSRCLVEALVTDNGWEWMFFVAVPGLMMQ